MTASTAVSSPIILRPHQVEAVNAVYDHLRRRDDNPCVVIPTAGGKTPVMATICRDAVQRWNGRVLILAHVKELLEQAVDKLHTMAPDLTSRIGVYSAGLKSRDTEHPIIIAGIQSVYRRAAELHSDLCALRCPWPPRRPATVSPGYCSPKITACDEPWRRNSAVAASAGWERRPEDGGRENVELNAMRDRQR